MVPSVNSNRNNNRTVVQDDMLEFHLRDLDFDMKRVPYPTVLLVAKRFAGKSWMSVAIAEQFKKPRWCAWCGTKDTEDFWAERFGSNASVRGPDERGKQYLIKQIRFQQRKVRHYKKILKQPFPRKYEIGFVFDDVTSKRNFRKGELLEDLFSNGRHYKAAIIISCQYLKQLPPAVRGNTDYLFMMHNSKKNIKLLFDEYVEAESYELFASLLKQVTNQRNDKGEKLHSALVFDNVQTSHDLSDQFKIYRHYVNFNVEDVLLGDESWRKFNEENYCDQETERHKKEHLRDLKRKRVKTYRKRQLLRRQNPSAYAFANMNLEDNLDLDVFSDTDSQEEDLMTNVEKIYVQQKRGKDVTIHLPSGPRSFAQPPPQQQQQPYARSSLPQENYIPHNVPQPSLHSWATQRQYLQENVYPNFI